MTFSSVYCWIWEVNCLHQEHRISKSPVRFIAGLESGVEWQLQALENCCATRNIFPSTSHSQASIWVKIRLNCEHVSLLNHAGDARWTYDVIMIIWCDMMWRKMCVFAPCTSVFLSSLTASFFAESCGRCPMDSWCDNDNDVIWCDVIWCDVCMCAVYQFFFVRG